MNRMIRSLHVHVGALELMINSKDTLRNARDTMSRVLELHTLAVDSKHLDAAKSNIESEVQELNHSYLARMQLGAAERLSFNVHDGPS